MTKKEYESITGALNTAQHEIEISFDKFIKALQELREQE